MSYQWVPNILCEIQDGNAYLIREYRDKMRCSGACHSCGSFLGVDLSDTGKACLSSCCTGFEVMPQTVSARH